MKHDHGLQNKLTAWFQRNPLKKAAIGYLTGIIILILLVALVKFLIEREKEAKKRRQIAVTPKNKALVCYCSDPGEASWRMSMQARRGAQNVPNSGQTTKAQVGCPSRKSGIFAVQSALKQVTIDLFGSCKFDCWPGHPKLRAGQRVCRVKSNESKSVLQLQVP